MKAIRTLREGRGMGGIGEKTSLITLSQEGSQHRGDKIVDGGLKNGTREKMVRKVELNFTTNDPNFTTNDSNLWKFDPKPWKFDSSSVIFRSQKWKFGPNIRRFDPSIFMFGSEIRTAGLKIGGFMEGVGGV
jgi:hypothetical protein